jgi:hypothetical protein
VRLIAVYLLANNPESGFEKVLDWVAKNDVNKSVRDMAILLSRSVPGGLPLNPPSAINSNNEPGR